MDAPTENGTEKARVLAEELLGRRMELMRFTTAGSVDDGKSTLIGRLLVDTKGVFEDQLAAAQIATAKRGANGVDLALLTDGLRAEREQGITIDVAYRYFSTPKRSFIIADTPGHTQYTRNMVTGASTASVAIILIDARHGVITQTKRHAFIATLLGIPHIIVAVNKMDLVDYDEAVFERIRTEFRDWARKLDVRDVRFIPISALFGDMVVKRGERMGWYHGYSLLEMLENMEISSDRNLTDFRFPVQLVSRPQTDEHRDFRGYAGRIESGAVAVGDDVVVLPGGGRSRVESISTFDGNLDKAYTPMSVTICLEDEIDISRGDMLVRPGNVPRQEKEFEAAICWMAEEPMQRRGKYLIKHTTNTVKGVVTDLRYRIDVNTLHRDPSAESLGMNEIGRVMIKTQKALNVDYYRDNRETGSFILIDPHTNSTVGAGMIWRKRETAPEPEPEWE
jgi:sulfate adenylyltransferase large subunit